MVDGVEQLQEDAGLPLFGVGRDLLQGGGAVFEALLVVHPGAVARQGDDVGEAGGGRVVDALTDLRQAFFVVLHVVDALSSHTYLEASEERTLVGLAAVTAGPP